MRSSHAATVALMEPFPTQAQVEAAAPAMSTLYEAAADVVRWKRTQASDDGAVSTLLAAEAAGTITPRETITLVSMLFTAGHQTTYSAVALSVLALLRHREQWDLLGARPDLLPHAVEECLRFDNTIQVGWRTTPHEREVGGRPSPRACTSSSGTAPPTGTPTTGARGPTSSTSAGPTPRRTCPSGADRTCASARGSRRIEIQSVLAHLIREHPDAELAAEPEWRHLISLRGPERLDLALPVRQARR